MNSDSMTVYTNEAAGTNNGFYTEPIAINYSDCGEAAGFFSGDTNFPGITSDGPSWNCPGFPEHFAMAATIKLQLAPGVYRMGVTSDDNFKVTAGGSAGTNLFIASSVNTLPDTTFDGQFEFVVQGNGVYNFRLVYEQGGGNATCEWYWVNRNTGLRTLVRPLLLLSSATVNGSYTADTTALIDPVAQTITVPKSGNTRFYRLGSSTAYTLNRPAVSGNNVVLTYQ
jgi:hypothetical protein